MSKDPLQISGMHNGAHAKVAKLREKMTEPEKKLLEYLRLKPQGLKFRRQHPIGFYVLDFYCHKLRISIELDGGYHLSREQKEMDESRIQYLEELGIKEYRSANKEVLNHFEATIESVEKILREAFRLRRTGAARRK
ncbi:MAG: endonuclease domain-containing protein [Cryomorphaceae bacterium]